MDLPSIVVHGSSHLVFASKTRSAFPAVVEEEEMYLEQVAKRHWWILPIEGTSLSTKSD